MKNLVLFLGTLIFSALSTHLSAKTLSPVWQVDGFKMPESVVYDEKRQQYYVSNVNKAPLQQDKNGSIGIIKDNGQQKTVDWITGLSSPKGLGLREDMLYVADVKELVIIDVAKGAIAKRIPAPDTMVLNGIAITDEAVFVSDWMGNAIYTVTENGLKLWVSSPGLDLPNGLIVKGDYLYVGAWGNKPKADFSTETTGNLKRISLKTKNIETLTNTENWMNLDGLHVLDNDTLITSDFIKGQILEIKTNGEITHSYDVGKTAADFYYHKDKNLVVIPYLMANKVVAFQYQ